MESGPGLAGRSLIARFMGPTWGPSGADRTQVGLMLTPWTLLSGIDSYQQTNSHDKGWARFIWFYKPEWLVCTLEHWPCRAPQSSGPTLTADIVQSESGYWRKCRQRNRDRVPTVYPDVPRLHVRLSAHVPWLRAHAIRRPLLQSVSGGRLNKKDGLTRYGDSHVKDKTS